MRKFLSLMLLLALSLALLGGCGKPAVYKDGTYLGVSDAHDKGYTQAEVTMKKDKIESVTIVGFDSLGMKKPDDYPHEAYHTAIVDLATEMEKKNTWDVAAIAQATSLSAEASLAAKRAMEKALVKPDTTATYFDGVFAAISTPTERGWTVALVTLKNDKITDVVLYSTTPQAEADGNGEFVRRDESYPHAPYFEAIEVLPQRFVAANGTDVEGVTGATSTTNEAKQAVEAALKLAKRK